MKWNNCSAFGFIRPDIASTRTYDTLPLCPLTLENDFSLPHEVCLDLLRHAETEANANGFVAGALDVSLTDFGRVQAERSGKCLAKSYDLAFSSPLSRAKETLRLATNSGDTTIHRYFEDPRLSERKLGVLENQVWSDIPEYRAGNLQFAPEGGESYCEVLLRILDFLWDLTRLVHDEGVRSILICSHAGPMRILVGLLEEERDPAKVLCRHFQNAHVMHYNKSSFTRPLFLGGAV